MCGAELEASRMSVCDSCPLHTLAAGCSLELVPCASCGYHALPEELTAAVAFPDATVDVPLACGAEDNVATQPLARLGAGNRARVAWVECGDEAINRRLLAYGLAPGARIEVLQRRPALILRIYETELALAPEVAEGIAVAVAPPVAQRG
jgi:Fe2+ transport system protein FeoA